MIGKNIRWLRQREEMTQEEFSGKFGVLRATLANWEKGRVRPNDKFLAALCKKYSLTLDDLYNRDMSQRTTDKTKLPSTNQIHEPDNKYSELLQENYTLLRSENALLKEKIERLEQQVAELKKEGKIAP